MGTASTLIVKGLYQTESIGYGGVVKPFEKPLFVTFLMFLGMACAVPLHFAVVYFGKKNSRSAEAEALPLVGSSGSKASSGSATPPDLRKILDNKSGLSGRPVDSNDPFGDDSSSIQGSQVDSQAASEPASPYDNWRYLLDFRVNLVLLVPSVFDLLGSALSTIGLLYTSVSVYQLSRCTVIIVTAVLKASVLRHPLSSNMWAGVVINAVAMMLVGSTAFFDAPPNSTASEAHGDPRVGIAFILASCLVQGAQYVFEEKVMAFDAVPPLILVGMEGVWGCVLCLAAVFPFAYLVPGGDNGHYEDVLESVEMLRNSTPLLTLLVAFVLIVFVYNVSCIYITFLLNSIWHAIMDNCRPVAVWACGLALFYSTGKVGEPWTSSSWLELLGMTILFYGTAVYNGNVIFMGLSTKVPCEDGEEEDEEEEGAALPFRDTLPATPRFGAHTPLNKPVDAVKMLTQSPALRPSSPHLHGHSHGLHGGHGHSHAHGAGGDHGHSHGLPKPSSRAGPQGQGYGAV